jgi:RimJ/RimL family protein N-acetyltransferase
VVSGTPYPLRTERLLVRMPREDDIDVLTAYRNDPDVARLQDWDLPYPRERAEWLVAAHADRDDVAPGEGTQLALDLDGQLVGDVYVGLDAHCGIAEIGFTLAAAHHGQGYAVEAVSAVVDDLVDRLGVHRIVGELSPDNLASARLLERLGMTFEYFAAKSFWWRGAWDDNLFYSMTADERRAWRDRPRQAPYRVRLVELTHENFRDYQRLRTHRSQERFAPTVEESYAEALFPEPAGDPPVVPVLRGIEADGEPVGFLMYADAADEGTAVPHLWRFLVDRRHQGRGIGARALQTLRHELRSAGHLTLQARWVQAPAGPEPFFLRAGFVPTGEPVADEVVARLAL